jgi:hypothetical protein
MNKCQCSLEDFPCGFCHQEHQKQMQEEHDRKMADYHASLMPCKFCSQDCEYGWCEKPLCQEKEHNARLIDLIDDDGWRCEDPYDLEPGKSDCQHQWVLSFDCDVDCADAERVCRECGRKERQNMYNAPEPPNCYVPGYGWMVI